MYIGDKVNAWLCGNNREKEGNLDDTPLCEGIIVEEIICKDTHGYYFKSGGNVYLSYQNVRSIFEKMFTAGIRLLP